MTPRLLAAAAVALASLTLSSASAATETSIVYVQPSVMQAGAANEVRAYVETPDGGRVGGPAGSETALRFTIGSTSVLAKAAPGAATVIGSIAPTQLGENLPMTIAFAGDSRYAASRRTVAVDVWEYVLRDETGAGMLLVNPSLNEVRVVAGSYDSGSLTNVQMTAAGPAIVLDVDALDGNGDPLQLKGSFAPERGTFAVAGLAAEPFALARI